LDDGHTGTFRKHEKYQAVIYKKARTTLTKEVSFTRHDHPSYFFFFFGFFFTPPLAVP
jgi:hypothetical protein